MEIDYYNTKKCRRCKMRKNRSEFRQTPCGRGNTCKICRKMESKVAYENVKEKKPWRIPLQSARKRCGLSGVYAEKGRKCFLTEEGIKRLWIRDKAHLMKRASLDRKDNDGDYTYENCQFIEHSLNSSKRGKYFARFYCENE